MKPVFELEGIKKSYRNRTIVDIDHLSVFEGEILSIVGPSGAGKSTLLRMLNFIEFPDQGKMTYQGQLVNRSSLTLEQRRQVTTVFQHPALLSSNVENNIRFGLQLRGIQDGKESIHQILQHMGLENMAKAPARTLSGGEAQRVALARALVIHPRVLLLDEPTANLDPYNIGLIENVVKNLNEQRHTTIVLVTHNIFQAKRLAHRVGLLLNGQLVEINDTRSFFDTPKDSRTRSFVNGEMVY